MERNLEDSDVNYVGGIIPVKKHRSERARPIEKGTRLLVDGHARGPIPLIANLPKPGPHTLRLEIPGWQSYTFKLEKSFRLRVGEGEIESWTPLLANCKTGQIFTAEKLPSFDPYQCGGAGGTPGTQFKLGKDPMLVVTTTDHRRLRGLSKIGEMKPLAAPR